jgi:DNA-binding transcriptional MocR family regulator
MTLIPHRTVASQLAVQLRAELTKGTWRGWLPSERVLSRTLQASRNTVRAALEQFFGWYASDAGRFGRYLLAGDMLNPMWDAQFDTPADLQRVRTLLTQARSSPI